jgi:hypothetical protein
MAERDDLQRARDAHERVQQRARGSDWRDYRAIVLKMPVLIHRDGLVPALHFIAARTKPGQRAILEDLARDLGRKDVNALLAWSRGLDDDALRAQTREVMRRVAWYKRIVQAFGRDPSEPGREASP